MLINQINTICKIEQGFSILSSLTACLGGHQALRFYLHYLKIHCFHYEEKIGVKFIAVVNLDFTIARRVPQDKKGDKH